MSIAPVEILLLLFLAGILVANFFIYLKNLENKKRLQEYERKNQIAFHELEAIEELSEKAGYSTNLQNAIFTINQILDESIEYNTISYAILHQEKIIFETYVKNPVSRNFIESVKNKTIKALLKTLKINPQNISIDEKIWGPVLSEDHAELDKSSFIIPIVISEKLVGILNIASEKQNLYSEKEIKTADDIVKHATKTLSKIQEALEREKKQLNAMVASMTDGIIMSDLQDQLIVVNPAAKKAFGLELKKDLSINDFANGLSGKIDLLDKIEESERLEKVFVSEEISLSTGFFKIIISPAKDQWRTLGSITVFRNITQEKELERIKEDFISMIVHELRSPLDSIKKMIALMRETKMKKEEQENCFQMIYSSSSEMLELISNLLNMAKIEAGKFQIIKEKADIKSIILSRISFFEISAKDAKVALKTCFADDLPPTADFDPRAISQVLNNLISNAIKFTKENGEIILQAIFYKSGQILSKEAKQHGINWFIKGIDENIPDSLLIAVTDSGIGIDKNQIKNLFSKFSQARNIFIEKEGTGLGLAIVKNIIDSHGGIVGADSEQGRGSTFYFTIPFK